MILTRYLYQKHHVKFSMYCAILSNNKDEAYFWAYELYFSGFKEETLELLIKCYKKYYSTQPWFSKLEKYILTKYDEWKKDEKQDCIVGTMIENILKASKMVNNTKLLFVKITEKDILKYKSSPFVSTKGWKMPRRLCIYSCHEDPEVPFMATIRDYWDWSYYAMGSPFWEIKIKKYGGAIDMDQKKIIFSDEDKEEEFYNLYDMEPDEQPTNILLNWGIKPYFGTNL